MSNSQSKYNYPPGSDGMARLNSGSGDPENWERTFGTPEGMGTLAYERMKRRAKAQEKKVCCGDPGDCVGCPCA